MYLIYILKSGKDSGYYVGMTTDLNTRLAYHNNGRVISTKNRRPWELIYSEGFNTRIEAREREKYLKSYKGAGEKMKIIKTL